MKRKRLKKKSSNPLPKLKAEAWRLWSRFIRYSAVEKDGLVQCFTCPERRPPEKMQAGHFKHGRLDFDKRNIRPQCPACNKWWSGRLDVYAENLIKESGPGIIEEISRDANVAHKYSRQELEETIEKYKEWDR